MGYELSIVIPVYNSEKTLSRLCNELIVTLSEITTSYEIIFVEDCSNDNSYLELKKLSEVYKHMKIIKLAKNFGQHNAILCGLNYAEGEICITMDDDLQNPPNQIPLLLELINQGFDVVIGSVEKKKQKIYKNLGSKFINLLNTKILGKPQNIKLSSFRAIKKQVVKNMVKYKGPFVYLPALIFLSTDKITNVNVEHKKRKEGSSNYNLLKSISLASNLIINYSSLPLRILSSIGFSVSFISMILGIYFLLKKIIWGINIEGWTSLITSIFFLNGIIILAVGILGEYLIRILKELSNVPQFIVKEIIKGD